MRLLLAALLASLVPGSWASAEAPCGTAPDDLCQVASGQYRIALPEGAGDTAKPMGAMLWLHGWGGSANGSIRNKGIASQLHARGMAYVAADGVITSDRYKNKNWAVNDGRPYQRDDIAFLREIVDDLVARHGIDRERILLGGFSRGGSMVWDVACRAPDLARAYVPVAGAFWEPMWESCEGPVDLFHAHGWTDRTVPLEGRPLGGGTMTQGDVWQSLFILRAANGCGNRQPETAPVEGDGALWMRSWSDCASGKRIDLMLHPRGHSIPKGWMQRALDWWEGRLAAG